MKFNLDKAIVDNVINKIGKILTTNNSSIPILNGVLIHATEQFIAFTASNGYDSILIREMVNSENGVEVLEVGAAVLPSEIFNLTKKLKPGAIEFTTNEDCTQINVKQKRTKIDFSIEQAEQFPSIASNQNPTGNFKLSAKEFEEIVKTTGFAVAKNDSRPVLQGIKFTFGLGENGLAYHAIATDSHRLAQLQSPTPITEGAVSITIPAQSLQQAVKSFDSNDKVAIVTYTNQIALVNGNTIIYSRLLEGNYPQTDRLIPITDSVLMLNTEEILDALELMKEMKDNGKDSASCRLTVGTETALLESHVPGSTSRTQQEIQVISNTNVEEGFKIAFDVKFALEALRTIHTKQVKVELSGALRPFVFKNVYEADSSKTPDALQLILPMRTY
ncbi:DNA polymerase III subunit beta (plasmid) [Ureibacillus chungkukjangi]|uniref:DNA polymerase III subunit beta n=1 Tax=Ureibacillus chungkukjangi TaxID=1202712 RepID=UPI000D336FF0|nr:DNA polymerase III subunit beta [Ureibacillus chungkukjangi]MCM3390538.1 DNA polymerase III subunit beta [Ureibacillus chungkukjangi]